MWDGTASGGSALGEADCVEGSTCDTYTLTVSGTSTDWKGKFIAVDLTWLSPSNDYDLYIHKDSNSGPIVDSSGQGATTNEHAIIDPSSSGTGIFTVHVVYFLVTPGVDQYHGTAAAQDKPPVPPPPTPGQGPAPRYQNYAAPGPLGNDAGEPSIGVNWKTGNVMFESFTHTLRVSFDDCSSPAKATWVDKSAFTSVTSLDPILFLDHNTGSHPNRCFVSQLAGKTSLMSYSDNDGETWTPSQGGGIGSGVDHQTVGGGPFHTPLTRDPNGSLYPNVVVYCSQDVADALCATSLDGGQTFGAAVPIYTAAQCGGLHGHVKVALDGTIYVPNKRCGGQQAVVVSENNGLTWSVRKIPNSLAGDTDPSVGIATDGTVYFGYDNGDGRPRIAVSADRGLTWKFDTDVGFGSIVSTVFPAVVAGDADRAAFAFHGTMTVTNQVWFLFIATTYDGGKSWITINATPDDPVQRGTICTAGISCGSDRNLLDFFDASIDAQGRVLVAYADGCIGACVTGTQNSFSAKATIARQSGGRRMFAAFDALEPTTPAAPQLLSAIRDRITGDVTLSWAEPDNGGSAITAYKVYRSTTSGAGFTLLATVDATKTELVDAAADPSVTYFYRVTAVNAVGEGPFCGEITPVVITAASPCTLPGILVSEDVSDTGQNRPPDPRVDIKAVYVAEPWFGAGVNRLVLTLKVGKSTLGGAPPSSQWYILWGRPNPDAQFDRNYVAMKTDALSNITFEYGKISPPSVNLPTKFGAADGGSYDADTGTITITISDDKVDNVAAGSTLSSIHARTFFSRADGLPVTQLASSDFSPDGTYTLVGNLACKPNNPPTAILTATPQSGLAPLTVSFSGAQSSDPDGDAITSYTFNFGDGSPSVTESGPTVSHTYNASGEYRATLTVKDARGLQSANVAALIIDVEAVTADLSATKTDAPDPVLAGQELTYTITVSNAGPQAATGTVLTDTLPAGSAFVSATTSQGTCSGTSTVSCNLGTINSGSNATVTLKTKPMTAGTITNTASATANEADPDTANNTASATTTVNPAADLSITKTDSPDPVHQGQPLTYTIKVTNNGPSTATGVTLTDQFGKNAGFGSVTTTQGTCSLKPQKALVTCNLGDLASGSSATVTLVVKPVMKGTITNTAAVSATSPTDPNTANNSASTTTTVTP
jgi:uncharacterized repeat protein (TIGR01451 family)